MSKSYFFCLVFCSGVFFTSCDRVKEIKNQVGELEEIYTDDLRVLGLLYEQYGGSWNIDLSGDAYTIEITNAKRLSNKDSIEHHAAVIARLIMDSIETKHNYLELEIITDSRVGVFNSTKSYTWIEPLTLCNMFRNLTIEEYIPIKNAITAQYYFNSMDVEYFDKGDKILDDLAKDSENFTPFYYLALASKALYLEDSTSLKENLKIAYEMGENNFRFLQQYAGFYFYQLNEIERGFEYFKVARVMEPKSNIHLDIYNAFFHLEQYDSALQSFDNYLTWYPDDFETLIGKYNLLNQLKRDSAACVQLEKIITLEPQVNIPDSLLNKCQILWNPNL